MGIILIVVLAVLLCVLTFVLSSPLGIRVKYDGELCVYASLSFIKIRLLPKKERKEPRKSKKDKKQKKAVDTAAPKKTNEQQNKDKDSAQNEDKEKKSILDTIILASSIVKSFGGMLGKKGEIEIDALFVTVSCEDAADTAVKYGLYSGAVSTVVALTSLFGKAQINENKVGTQIDFISGKSKLNIDIKLSAAVINILVSLIKGYLLGLQKGKERKGRKSRKGVNNG